MVRFNSIKSIEISTEFLLPVVPLTVVASSGGIIWSHLPDFLQSSTLVLTFILWANAIMISLMITTVYMWKLFIYKIPHIGIVFSSFIPIGFSGQGAYAIQLFGTNYYQYQTKISQSQESFIAAVAIKHITIFIGLMLQTLGYFLTFLAIVSVLSYLPNIRFNKNWWAMTFPMGTMSLASTETFKMTGWYTFKVLGAIYGVFLIVITIVCLIGSLIWETPRSSSYEPKLKKDLENGIISSDQSNDTNDVDFMVSNRTYVNM
ncbi:putative membrane protein [Wickerhamomyces ciferrii]|uniref:Membrane protein n=1 Tax=Wickerhamomyces ciferrii (strain ATCC 14091 / BCRC 22168 / CBS 111 / JCM 3599 / NBRC 0793 / NRRL Y-1031 F-60-10) TaxID=1206466 RepID=K0KER1_WICCF|nr:uncharacterized protein BN7_241 [Wickerhamomyces ciferrii]CCH40707.1 putative membrane protein [Wickerhamomyces ciferrii]